MKKLRLTALFLVIVTVISALSACNLGKIVGGNTGNKDDGTDGRPTGSRAEADTTQTAGALENAKPGDKFTLGAWEQDGNTKNGAEAITWTVLYQHVGKALVVSDRIIEFGYFKEAEKDQRFTHCLYKDSDVRRYLNGDFYENAFTDGEKKLIMSTTVKTPYVEDYKSKISETEERVFLLSVDEVTKYMTGKGSAIHGAPTEYLLSKFGSKIYSLRDVDGFGKAMTWWLRDMGDSSDKAACVEGWETKASAYGWDVDSKNGIRPAMWVMYDENDVIGYANGNVEPKEDAELNKRIAALKVGDKFSFGLYDKNPYVLDGYEDLEWKVLDEDDTSFLMITTGIIGQSTFMDAKDGKEPEHADWSVSDLRRILNGDEMLEKLFTPQERAKIALSHVTTEGGGSWKRDGGPDTDDLLFVPSREEIEKYFPTEDERKLGEVSYWLRTPDFVEPHIKYVYESGGLGDNEATSYSGVRVMARIKK